MTIKTDKEDKKEESEEEDQETIMLKNSIKAYS